MIFQRSGIGACPVDAVMGDELLLGTDLRVVGRLELPVLHMVVF